MLGINIGSLGQIITSFNFVGVGIGIGYWTCELVHLVGYLFYISRVGGHSIVWVSLIIHIKGWS